MRCSTRRVIGIALGAVLALPAAAQTAKSNDAGPIRILVVPAYAGYTKSVSVPYPEFYRRNLAKVAQALNQTGYAEIVRPEDVDAVAGKDRERFSRKATPKLLRETAAKLGAEYAMSVVLKFDSLAGNEWRISLIGTESGSTYSVNSRVPIGSPADDFSRLSRIAIARIFQDARADMLAAAVRKRGESSAKEAPEAGAGAPTEIERDLDLAAAEREEAALGNRPPLAVPDLDGEGGNRTALRILSEALRYELLAQGKYRIVEREKLDAVLREIELQASGLVGDDQAAKIGEAAAAKQIVLGSAASLGSIAVIQVRRIDLQTQVALGAGTLTYEAGREIDALKGMPGLAQELARDR